MIIPILRSVYNIFEVEDITDFVVPARAFISYEDFEADNCFYFRIITPKRLHKIVEEHKIIDGWATFIVNEKDMGSNLKLVESKIQELLEDCRRETWKEVALAINNHLKWEFYDPSKIGEVSVFYKPMSHED